MHPIIYPHPSLIHFLLHRPQARENLRHHDKPTNDIQEWGTEFYQRHDTLPAPVHGLELHAYNGGCDGEKSAGAPEIEFDGRGKRGSPRQKVEGGEGSAKEDY